MVQISFRTSYTHDKKAWDPYWTDPKGLKFRSRLEIARHLGLEGPAEPKAQKPKKEKGGGGPAPKKLRPKTKEPSSGGTSAAAATPLKPAPSFKRKLHADDQTPQPDHTADRGTKRQQKAQRAVAPPKPRSTAAAAAPLKPQRRPRERGQQHLAEYLANESNDAAMKQIEQELMQKGLKNNIDPQPVGEYLERGQQATLAKKRAASFDRQRELPRKVKCGVVLHRCSPPFLAVPPN